MGYRVGGPFGSASIGPSAKQAKGVQVAAVDEQRFLSSYAATFSRSTAQLGAQGALRATLQPGMTASRSLRIAATNSIAPASTAAGPGSGSTLLEGRPMSKSWSETALGGARNRSGLAASGTVRRVDKEVRRRTLELLADPDLGSVAQGIFRAHDTSGNGRLELSELMAVLQTLHRELDLPEANEVCVESLFKKFDVNDDKALAYSEFFELFKSTLRRSAFDRSTLLSREFFINRRSEDIWKHFDKKKQLGSGTFGTAYLARDRTTGEERVVKAVKKNRTNLPLDEIEQEILIMRQVDHPHIVRLFEWYEDAGKFYLVLEALKGGTLKDVLLLLQNQKKGLREAWIRKVVCQTTEGMAYCHNLRLIHKDLKDENIMLLRKDPDFEEPFAIVIDLGIAEMFSVADPSGREMGGTPMTMAPEVWMGSFGPKCDVFSLGVILFELLSGSYPFMAASTTASAWVSQHKRGPDWTKVRTSGQGKALCKAMLTYSESERPTMHECCEHQWFAMDHRELKVIPPMQFAPFANFCRQQHVKRSLLLEIASRLPMERAAEVVEIFKSLDINRDGTLSPVELLKFFQKMGVDDPVLAGQTFKALDADQDGSLTFTEFASGALLLFTDKIEDSLRALFQQHDPNGDGALDGAEAKDFLGAAMAAMSFHGVETSPEVFVDRLLQGAKSRNVSFEQLREYILGAGGVASPVASARSSRRSDAALPQAPRSR